MEEEEEEEGMWSLLAISQDGKDGNSQRQIAKKRESKPIGTAQRHSAVFASDTALRCQVYPQVNL